MRDAVLDKLAMAAGFPKHLGGAVAGGSGEGSDSDSGDAEGVIRLADVPLEAQDLPKSKLKWFKTLLKARSDSRPSWAPI